MYAKSAVLAFFAAFAAAQLHEPVGDTPQGNPITKPLLEVRILQSARLAVTMPPLRDRLRFNSTEECPD
jgi:hypothetical protein